MKNYFFLVLALLLLEVVMRAFISQAFGIEPVLLAQMSAKANFVLAGVVFCFAVRAWDRGTHWAKENFTMAVVFFMIGLTVGPHDSMVPAALSGIVLAIILPLLLRAPRLPTYYDFIGWFAVMFFMLTLHFTPAYEYSLPMDMWKWAACIISAVGGYVNLLQGDRLADAQPPVRWRQSIQESQ